MKVTLDTNVLVSALEFGGVPGALLDLNTERAFILCISPIIVNELRRILGERFAWSSQDLDSTLQPILSRAQLVQPTRIVAASPDPDDDHILACAAEAGADVNVSGDRHLLILESFEGIPILTVRQFLILLSESNSQETD